jgi:hypothetical protein
MCLGCSFPVVDQEPGERRPGWGRRLCGTCPWEKYGALGPKGTEKSGLWAFLLGNNRMIASNDQGTENRRLLRVTPGNVSWNHLYVTGHYDFFPPDCIGGPKRSANRPTINIQLDGLDRTVTTDIGRDAKTGKPRGFLRGRGWVRQFFEHHGVKAGALLALDRISERDYRLSVHTDRREVCSL